MDARIYPSAGRLIDVGGHSLHLTCTGSGSPTVVLEAGGGGTSSFFGWILPAVARDTRVCAYDRAGYGWSQPADAPQDGLEIAADLRVLLRRGDIAAPYVLAGHSFGGLYVRTFAARYPEETAGLVLIDSTAASSTARPGTAVKADRDSYDAPGRVSALLSLSARLALIRIAAQLDFDSLPPGWREEARASAATARQLRSTIDEYVSAGPSVTEASLLDSFDDKPLVVLTAGSGSAPGWFAKQDAMAALSTNSAHHVVEGATHESLITDEEDAAATARAVRDVVEAVRSGVPLTR